MHGLANTNVVIALDKLYDVWLAGSYIVLRAGWIGWVIEKYIIVFM